MASTSTGKMKSAAEVAAHYRYQIERFEAEARFADALCEFHPDSAGGWQPLVHAARERVACAVNGGSLDALVEAVREAESILAPLGETAKSYALYCAGHAHIDMNWMWSWPETVAATNDSFLTVLRLMEEYPAFHFSQSQASVYAIIERHNPELLARIAQRVKEGRWEVTASHWVENDNNIAGGESLTRHLLYTRRYMQKLFGLSPEDVPINWCPDTFGHARTLPTYLTRGGVKYQYLHRPGVHLQTKPDAFWWQAPDGARLLVVNQMKAGYNQTLASSQVDNLIDFRRSTGAKEFLVVYGVGDHGGGPTRRDLVRGLDMATWPIYPTVKFTTARAYFEQLETLGDRLPTLDIELNTEFTGCYTTQTLIKKVCRFGEARLKDAEAAAGVAWAAAGFPYPVERLGEGWIDIIFNHFHDILPGSGVHDTRTYTHGLFQQTVASTSQIETQALRLLAAQVDTAPAGLISERQMPPTAVSSGLGGGVGFRTADGGLCLSDQTPGGWPKPFLLFNPLATPRTEVVEATLWDSEPQAPQRPLHHRPYVVRYADGATAPVQVIGGGEYWGHNYAMVSFPVTVPGLGYTLCVVDEVRGDAPAAPTTGAFQGGTLHHCNYAPRERSFEGIENEFLSLELDTTTGGIRRLVEKASGLTLITDAPLLEYGVERPHGMSAWSIEHTGPVEYPQVSQLHRTLAGPYRAALEVKATIKESNLTVSYELRAGDPKLYVHIAGVWFQRGTPQTGVPVLTFAMPVDVAKARGRYEIPFGSIERDLNNGQELPALQWAQVIGEVNGTTAGCVLLNDTKHGYSLTDNVLRLTLIRSSYEPDILPEIGAHDIHLAILPFAGEPPVSEVIAQGDALNHALRVISTDVHAGSLPAQAHCVALSPANVTLSGFKKAEDDDAFIVRVYETAGRSTTATIAVDASLLGVVVGAVEVDMMERPIAISTAKVEGTSVSVSVPAYGITTVKVKISK